MSQLIDIPISKIKPHPHNVRRDAVADQELIDSVAEQGILQPIGVVPDGAKYLLIAGHRRLAAAKGAKLKTVPAIVHEHLVTEAQQIEAMLVENGRRVDLTAMEEAEGYEQLELLGVDVAAIAAKTGRAATTVKQRLKLTTLPDRAKTAVHAGQVTLDQAADLARLAKHPKKMALVEKALGTHNFSWKLQEQLQRVATENSWAQQIREYKKRGLEQVQKPKGGWDASAGPVLVGWQHSRDRADAYFVHPDGHPELVVTTLATRELTDEERTAAVERERLDAEHAAAQAAHAAAETARFKFVMDLAPQWTIPKPFLELVAANLAVQLQSYGRPGLNRLVELSGVQLRRTDDYGIDYGIAPQIRALSATTLTRLVLAFMLVSTEQLLESTQRWGGRDNIAAHDTALAHLDWFETAGYQLPDIELEWRTNTEARRDELNQRPVEDSAA
jgi:ParB/RepB/Spo0J family partition protein